MLRLLVRGRFRAWALVLAFGPALVSAQPPDAPRRPERAVFLDKALDFERRQLWQQAADLYQKALRYYPEDVELRDRWHAAEQIYSLSRRYHDRSFQSDLLTLSESSAFALYREVLSKIQTHYVREVHLRDLVSSGYRTLGLALERPIFTAANFPHSSEDDLRRLKAALAQAAQSMGVVRTQGDAVHEVQKVVRLFERRRCVHNAAVVLEFVAGACETLDPYSTHLSPNRLADLYAMIDGNFVGLGVEVRGDEAGLRILSVLPDSPAEEAGLSDGETIVAVDDAPLTGGNAEDSANRLQGEAGTSVDLTVRDREGRERRVRATRREVAVHSVRDARLLEDAPETGYIRIDSFQKNTMGELNRALADLDALGMRRLVVDLRGNPGGLLDVSLEAANQFIGQGVLVSTRGRAWGQNWAHQARAIPTRDIPLAVLIDGESASASEIFAAAVQDHKRGVVVGARSYGKGSVQSIFPLSVGSTGLRLTTAHFFSPNGRKLQNVGIEPDVVVHRGEDALGDERPAPRNPKLSEDPQLRAAVEALAPLSSVKSR